MLPVAGKPHCHALVAELTEFELLEVLLDAEVAVQAGVCERLSCSPAARVQKHLCCIFLTLKRPVPSPVWGGTLIVAPVGSTEGQQRSVQFPSAGSRCRLTCESCNEITRLTSVCGPEDVCGPAGAEFQIRRPGRGPGSRKLSFWEAAFTFRTAAGWQVQTSESRHPGRASPSPSCSPHKMLEKHVGLWLETRLPGLGSCSVGGDAAVRWSPCGPSPGRGAFSAGCCLQDWPAGQQPVR